MEGGIYVRTGDFNGSGRSEYIKQYINTQTVKQKKYAEAK